MKGMESLPLRQLVLLLLAVLILLAFSQVIGGFSGTASLIQDRMNLTLSQVIK